MNMHIAQCPSFPESKLQNIPISQLKNNFSMLNQCSQLTAPRRMFSPHVKTWWRHVEERIINSICFPSVCAVTYSLLIILFRRLLWSYFQPRVIQNGALCHASMGSHSLDTKKTLSVNDITAISPIMLLSLHSTLSSFSVYVSSPSQNILHAWGIHYVLLFKMYPIFFFFLTACWEHLEEATVRFLCKKEVERNNKPNRKLWTYSSAFVAYGGYFLSSTTQERRQN